MRLPCSWRCALLVFDTVVAGCGGGQAAAVDRCPGDPSGCSGGGASPPPSTGGSPAMPAPRSQCAGGARRLPAASQADGDADVGFGQLLNGSYMSCGIPLSLWLNPLVGPLVRSAFPAGGVTGLPGREGDNAALPSSLVSFTAGDGAKVVNLSCLVCHGGSFDGEYIVGLGNVAADFTRGIADGSLADTLPPALLDLLLLSPPERANLDKMLRVARSVGPYTAMRVVGNNPAEALAGVLFAHHDAETLAWSDTPVISMKVYDDAGVEVVDPILTSDPPPWWRVKKKSALFYNGMARGQHRGTEEIATLACVDNVAEARRVDAIFRDLQAFVRTVPQPRWHRGVDGAMAARGRDVFEDHCSCCHGSYADEADDDAHDWYPNLIVPLAEIGTDPVVAKIGAWAPQVKDWYDRSLYSEVTPAVVDDPFFGYVAPPLDAVWATAPYLHNGSVPSLELLLDSKRRPARWRRVDYDDRHYDEAALGWPWQAAPSPAEVPAGERKLIYDTSAWGQGNGGHTFGDVLTVAERRDVIEYLKTL